MRKHIKLLILVAVALVWGASDAEDAVADSVRTTRRVKMMKRPGEQSRVVKRVPSGKNLKVLKRSGRWVQVRYGSESGWVTRTSVRSEGVSRSSMKPRRRRAFVNGRATREEWTDSAPEDRIGGDAVEDTDDWDEEDFDDDDRSKRKKRRRRAAKAVDDLDDEDWADEDEDDNGMAAGTLTVIADEADIYRKPSTRSKSLFVAESGDKLYLVDKSSNGKWVQVEDSDGEAGWVKASVVRDDSPYEYERLSYRADGGLGFTALGTEFASNGVGNLANYQMSSRAGSVVIGGEVLYAGGSDTRLLRGDLAYRGSRSSPGIRYDDGAGNIADIGFMMHEIDLGASYGYRFKRKDGLAAYGRAGYYYGQFRVSDGEDIVNANIARLPSELLQGITIGARVEAPRITDKIGASVTASYLVTGSRTQTEALEDGQVSSQSSYWATAQAVYQYNPKFKVVGSYRFFSSKTDWTGAAPGSMRGHLATEAARKDTAHAFSVGVGKSF